MAGCCHSPTTPKRLSAGMACRCPLPRCGWATWSGPNTRVRTPEIPGGRDGEIMVLSLKAPEPRLITGFIRGISADPDGEVRSTVSDIWLKLISLRVGLNATTTKQGQTLAIQDLTVGQVITQGTYNLVTLVAGRRDLVPAKVSARASLGR